MEHVRHINNIICISIKGTISEALTPEDQKSIRDLLQKDNPLLLFDLSSIEYLETASLRVILDATKKINSKQGKVVLCSPNRYVREIFEVSGLSPLIPIAESVESGLSVHSPFWR